MPVGSRLAEAEIRAIEQWIRDGAAWPAGARSSAASSPSHWAFEPVRKPSVPPGRRVEWPANEIDRFILSALEKAGLTPAPAADRTTLIRRLSFVLTGLPPRWEDVARFVNDRSPDAYQSLVDRLLASPHYGEHWARHWMDLARYGETRGYEWNYEIVGAWRYRDYLIRAFNSDVPYDQFVREHIAGDLLEEPRINVAEGIHESKIATAFHRLGEAGHDDCIQFRELSTDVIDNQIDTLSKTFQGLTVACARCHDHKLDPIPTEDYYGAYGIFNSSRPVVHTLDLPAVHASAKQRLRDGKEAIRRELAALWIEALPRVVLPAADDKTPLESPAYPLTLRNQAKSSELGAAWNALAGRYRAEQATRAAFNRENFLAFGDFRNGFGNWFADGVALGEGVQPSGDFAITPEGKTVVSGIYPAGVFTHTLSNKFNAALRSPYLPKDKKYLSVRVMGGKLGARRTVIDNCAIGEQYKTLENETLEWVRLDTYAKQERLPVYFEMVTKTVNPRIPDRPGMLKGYSEQEIVSSPRSYFGITSAVLHDIDETPREDLGHMLALFDATPASEEELKEIYVRTLRRALERWAAGQASDHDAIWLDWAVRSGVLPNGVDASPRLQELVNAYRTAEAAVSAPRTVEGLADQGGTFDVPVLLTGDPKNPGPITPRHFLSLLGNRRFQVGSGRRELAELIASPANPLTARVMVNRVWHHLFGRGLVKTTDNFGSIADPPTHPELLDYLAWRFMSEGWSVKKLIREIVLSSTFQQSGRISAAAVSADPHNLLLHHYPLRRLPAESIRDAILSASGRLERKLYGPGVDPHRPEPQDYRRLFSGPLDGDGRRSIYTRITRMEGAKFLEVFDYPPPLATRGERDVTNVPAQALALLNDAFVTAQAEQWAGQLTHSGSTIEQKVTEMFRSALGRDPTSPELERFRGLALEVASLHATPRSGLLTSRAVWKDVAHAIFNLKEFVYVQ
jgi:hypothetical protein